jgi:signal transduction histidine kinase
LINNSVEAIEMTGFISVIATAENGRMLIEIRDSGIGIPQSVLTKIGANPFSHGKANGNGLGLYHAIHTVNHYGGELTVNSTPGRGTLVRLAMPFQVETPEAPAAPHSFK